MTEHDARTGFHDIKPLPNFSPINTDLILISIFILVGLILITLWFKRNPKIKTQSQLPSDQLALQKIELLENKRASETINTRTYSSELSLIVRTYLEENFNFPATDLTTNQISFYFDNQVKTDLSSLPEFERSELCLTLRNFLLSCDEISFSSTSEIKFNLKDIHLIQLAKIAVNMVKNISQTLIAKKMAETKKT